MGWKPNEVEEDKEFEGSLFQKVGQTKYLCPVCGAHLSGDEHDLICLNACHLSADSRRRFSELMKKVK